jgi:hypothetical protein
MFKWFTKKNSFVNTPVGETANYQEMKALELKEEMLKKTPMLAWEKCDFKADEVKNKVYFPMRTIKSTIVIPLGESVVSHVAIFLSRINEYIDILSTSQPFYSPIKTPKLLYINYKPSFMNLDSFQKEDLYLEVISSGSFSVWHEIYTKGGKSRFAYVYPSANNADIIFRDFMLH